MIFIGLAGMGLFLYGILQPSNIGQPFLYYLLVFAMVFFCLKILYEWYHYFDITVPAQPKLTKAYSVDILTTFCAGEPYEMIVETLEAIQKITYPHTAYLCDEANDPYLIEVCERLGVQHVTREKKINAKAGNINNALHQYATGDLCVILDPDHVPAPDFLDPILPYFEDPSVGYVQVVQAYENINENVISRAAAQQTFQFYGPIMMCMNTYGTTQAIGANCTFRREALDSIGGHASGLAEDMNTSMKLHAEGWRSIYVPRIVTRGLVPSSLSAYYKQQLKWSRGVFELLVTTYIQNFGKFSFRQKLHYGLLPWHYFSGAIYLINFLIPILSLVFDVMPMKIGLADFMMWGALLFTSIIMIRHYVQRWVMEEKERGFHLVGGLLQIGTWWIHLLGFIFTILRKKIAYDPTPKDGKEENLIGLSIPNITVGLLSLSAIIYGLNQDYNPYNLIMAGFASINICFVIFMVAISYQARFHRLKRVHPMMNKLSLSFWNVRKWLWLGRHKVYGGLRRVGLPAVILVCGVVSYFYVWSHDLEHIEVQRPTYTNLPRYLGIYVPTSAEEGGADLTRIKALASQLDMSPTIVSTYLAWNRTPSLPSKFLEEVYAYNAYPMITWEPWIHTFDLGTDTSLTTMQHVLSGALDDYLLTMGRKFAEINKPIFLRFAHEPDNPAYPWYATDSGPKDYRKAWKHVHDLMVSAGARNVIWVFNPWKPQAAISYYPGDDYVDWLSLTALNYGATAGLDNWRDFEGIYNSFYRTVTFQHEKPVMLAEFGTLSGKGKEEKWFQDARHLIGQHPEIRACVLFASDADRNLPIGHQEKRGTLDWHAQADHFKVFRDFQKDVKPPNQLGQLPVMNASSKSGFKDLYKSIRGVDYSKATDWKTSLHPLFRRVVRQDFQELNNLGIEWIRRYGPGVYDENILKTAKEASIKIIYGLWVDENLDWTNPEEIAGVLKDLTKIVNKYKDEETIAAWHVGGAVYDQLANKYPKPDQMYVHQTYLTWLEQLTSIIKDIDPDRPVSIEINTSADWPTKVRLISSRVPKLDAIGLNLLEDIPPPNLERANDLPLFINRLSVDHLSAIPNMKSGWVIAAWQDDVYHDHIGFNGLVDYKGRKKSNYKLLEDVLNENKSTSSATFSILRPAKWANEGNTLKFQALLQDEDIWKLAKNSDLAVKFSWQLVKTDNYHHAIAMQDVGQGPVLDLQMPESPHLYKVRLTAVLEGYAHQAEAALITPIYEGPDLEELSREEIQYRLR